MNAQRRKRLVKVQDLIEIAKEELESILEEEEEARDNIPESLQSTERYERANAACDALSEAVDSLEGVSEKIEEACEQ